MKFPINDFLLQILSHLLKKSLMENFHFLCSDTERIKTVIQAFCKNHDFFQMLN